MSETAVTSQIKPNLYRGKPIPLRELSPEAFEDFVYCALKEVGKQNSFKVTSGRQPSGDGGFDVTAESDDGSYLICIQCKRYTDRLNSPTLGAELAKVALQTKFEGSNVKVHYLISTGKVSSKLRSQIRQTSRQEIIDESIKQLGHKDLNTLTKKCRKNNLQPYSVVSDYVTSLNKIIVWSGTDFDNELGTVWSKISDSIDRYFSLETVLREFPRPDFNYDAYIKEIESDEKPTIELSMIPIELPYNLEKNATNQAWPETSGQTNPASSRELNSSEVFCSTLVNQCRVLLGPGGSGKTTVLYHSQKAILDNQHEDNTQFLPIYLKLSGYTGNLDKIIHQKLNIHNGNWTSLPYHFFLLLDGVDEIPDGNPQLLFDELTQVTKRHNIKSVISLRETGLSIPAYFEHLESCYGLQKLSFRDCIGLAEMQLLEEDVQLFLPQFRSKSRTFASELFSLPFGFCATLGYFKDHKQLPDNLDELLGDILERRIKHNRTRRHDSDKSINSISKNTIRKLAGAVAFEFRIVRQRTEVSLDEGELVVASALQRIKNDSVFGASELTDEKALATAIHYEVLRRSSDNMIYIDHDIVADYLASDLLAQHWRDYSDKLDSKIGQDVWIFAAKKIPERDKQSFFDMVIRNDVVLASHCAIAAEGECISQVEPQLFLDYESESLIKMAKAAHAMTILGTPKCIQRLKSNITASDRHRRYQSKRALALAGDYEFLQGCLDDNERMKAGGLNPSGGSYDMWFMAPPMVATEIARENILQSLSDDHKFVPMALETVQRYGDKSDEENVIEVIKGTENITEFYAAIWCLSELNKEAAISALTDIVNEHDIDQITLCAMNALFELKQDQDVTQLFSLFIVNNNPKPEEFEANKLVVKLLKNYSLPDNATQKLLNALKTANDFQFYNIWTIATAHQLVGFHDLAWEGLEGNNPQIVCAAIEYANACFIQEQDKCRYIDLCLTKADEFCSELQPLFTFNQILDALINLNENKRVAEIVSVFFKKHLPQYIKSNKHVWEWDFPGLLIQAAKVKEHLLPESLLGLIGMDISHLGDEALRVYAEILSILPVNILDSQIAFIEDQSLKIETLASIHALEKTSEREKMVIDAIPTMLTHHFFRRALLKLAKIYWSSLFASALFKAVSEHPWDNMSANLFDDVIFEIAKLISKEDAQKLILPVLATTTNSKAVEILKFWRDYAFDK